MRYLHHSILQFIIGVITNQTEDINIEEAVNYNQIYKGPFNLSQFMSKDDFPYFIDQLYLLKMKPYIQNFDFNPYPDDGKSYIEISKLMLKPNGDLPEVIITDYPFFNKTIDRYLKNFKNNKLHYSPEGTILRFKQQIDNVIQIIVSKYKDYERICLEAPLANCRILECLILLYKDKYIEFCPDISIKEGSSTPADIYFTITNKFKKDYLHSFHTEPQKAQTPEVNQKLEETKQITTNEDNKKETKKTKPNQKRKFSYLGITLTADNQVTYKEREIPFSSKRNHKQLLLLRLLLEKKENGTDIYDAYNKVGITRKHKKRYKQDEIYEDNYNNKPKYEPRYEKLRKVAKELEKKFDDDNLIFQCNRSRVCLLYKYGENDNQ